MGELVLFETRKIKKNTKLRIEKKKKKKPSKKTPLQLQREREKRRAYVKPNCFQDILLELMEERGIEPKHLNKALGLSYSVLNDWIYGKVRFQYLDGRILAIAKFFNVSIHYLAFGIGDDDPVFGDEKPWLRYLTSYEAINTPKKKKK